MRELWDPKGGSKEVYCYCLSHSALLYLIQLSERRALRTPGQLLLLPDLRKSVRKTW